MNSYNNVTGYQLRSESCILKGGFQGANLGLGTRVGVETGRRQNKFLDIIIGMGLQRATIHK